MTMRRRRTGFSLNDNELSTRAGASWFKSHHVQDGLAIERLEHDRAERNVPGA
jgi:hypothetical protein